MGQNTSNAYALCVRRAHTFLLHRKGHSLPLPARRLVPLSAPVSPSSAAQARGLLFFERLLSNVRSEFPNVVLRIPRTVVLATDVFDAFIEANELEVRAATRNLAIDWEKARNKRKQGIPNETMGLSLFARLASTRRARFHRLELGDHQGSMALHHSPFPQTHASHARAQSILVKLVRGPTVPPSSSFPRPAGPGRPERTHHRRRDRGPLCTRAAAARRLRATPARRRARHGAPRRPLVQLARGSVRLPNMANTADGV